MSGFQQTDNSIGSMLLSKRLHLVTGKGGVGKSVISVSLAQVLKKKGKKVLFVQMSPVETEMDSKTEFFHRIRDSILPLDYIYIEPKSALEEYGIMVLRFRRLYKMIFEDKMVKSSIKAMPSLSFLLLIGKLWYYCTLKDKSGRYVYDYVVVDAPSTGMAISMLNLPHIINDAAPSGPLRDRALDIENMLTDKNTTAVHIVSTCEETPVNEALEIYKVLMERLSIQFGILFVNQFEDIHNEDVGYIRANMSLLPECIRNCVIRKIAEIGFKKGEYDRLVSNISYKDRRIISFPFFENSFDTADIVENIS
ncbi:MAG: AAA family ATPase, partial [Deltaproteobacteria bacterium]|nr:AAA family ATPase [Deltaproteobacteria bacterium]